MQTTYAPHPETYHDTPHPHGRVINGEFSERYVGRASVITPAALAIRMALGHQSGNRELVKTAKSINAKAVTSEPGSQTYREAQRDATMLLNLMDNPPVAPDLLNAGGYQDTDTTRLLRTIKPGQHSPVPRAPAPAAHPERAFAEPPTEILPPQSDRHASTHVIPRVPGHHIPHAR